LQLSFATYSPVIYLSVVQSAIAVAIISGCPKPSGRSNCVCARDATERLLTALRPSFR